MKLQLFPLNTGHLLSYAANKTGGACFEEIATHLYGSKGMQVTTFCNLLCIS